jgi:hypothetical protein
MPRRYPEEDVVYRERQAKRHRLSTSPRRQIPFLCEPVFAFPHGLKRDQGQTRRRLSTLSLRYHSRCNRTTAHHRNQTLLSIRLRRTSHRPSLVTTPAANSTTTRRQPWEERRKRDGWRRGA